MAGPVWGAGGTMGVAPRGCDCQGLSWGQVGLSGEGVNNLDGGEIGTMTDPMLVWILIYGVCLLTGVVLDLITSRPR